MSDLPDPSISGFARQEAFRHFAQFEGRTQTQRHIKPLHEYVTCRLVLEGGFHPDELSPRPPLRVTERRSRYTLAYDPGASSTTEATILGGLKTKDVDIVASKEGIGPVLAVSCKGMTGAVRNLTNRLEETIGECTNIHIAYPTLVFGYLFFDPRPSRGRCPTHRRRRRPSWQTSRGGDPLPPSAKCHDGTSRDPERCQPLRGDRHGADRGSADQPWRDLVGFPKC